MDELNEPWDYEQGVPVERETGKPGVWFLTMMTWRGTSAGAVHSYGALTSPRRDENGDSRKYDLNRVLDEEAARDLNDNNERFGRSHLGRVKPGWVTHQFDDDQEVRRYAVAAFEALCVEGDVLVVGSAGQVGASEPLAGPADLVDQLRRLWVSYEEEDLTEYTDGREDLDVEWEGIIEAAGLGPSGKRRTSWGPSTPDVAEPVRLHIEDHLDELKVFRERPWED